MGIFICGVWANPQKILLEKPEGKDKTKKKIFLRFQLGGKNTFRGIFKNFRKRGGTTVLVLGGEKIYFSLKKPKKIRKLYKKPWPIFLMRKILRWERCCSNLFLLFFFCVWEKLCKNKKIKVVAHHQLCLQFFCARSQMLYYLLFFAL